MTNFALVIIDVQRDFLDPTTSSVGSWEKTFCVPGIEQLIRHAHLNDWPVIHVGTQHRGANTLPAHQQRRGIGPYCIGGSPGCEFVVQPQPGEIVLYKSWYSAFDSDLRAHLGAVTGVVWTGVATDCCIQQSAFDADRCGIRSIIPIQAVSASSCEAFTASLVALSKSAADVIDITELLNAESSAASLGTGDIERLARSWFREQESRIADRAGLDLDVVLGRLARGASSA